MSTCLWGHIRHGIENISSLVNGLGNRLEKADSLLNFGDKYQETVTVLNLSKLKK